MESETFDLLISELTMPGLTGSPLAQQILAIRPGLPILLCTGFSHLIDEQQAREMGIRLKILGQIDDSLQGGNMGSQGQQQQEDQDK